MRDLKTIKIFGDKYLLRKTFDCIDYCGDVCGFEVMDEDKNFLFHLDGKYEKDVILEIKWKIYRDFTAYFYDK